MKIVSWFAGFFEDQGDRGSSKRVSLYICLYYLSLIIKGSLDGKNIDHNILILVGVVILFSLGAITTEFLNKASLFKTEKTETKTTESSNTKT